MHFRDFKYSRPDITSVQRLFNTYLKQFAVAKNADDQARIINKINELRSEFDSMKEIATIRHAIDTTNEIYKKECDFFDETEPAYISLVNRYYQQLDSTKYREDLKQIFGEQLFKIASFSIKAHKPVIEEDLKQENRLATEFTRLIAGAKIEFEGKNYNLSGLAPFETSPIREIRRKASFAKYGFYKKHEKKLDEIFDQLVRIRTTIAHKLGFENFTELGKIRMLRLEYNNEMVAGFREQVRKYVVPLATKLRKRQQERLNIDNLYFYDEMLTFPNGNPTPEGSPDWIVAQAKRMFNEISDETATFFTFMESNGLMDLINKPNKAGGGFCDFISLYKAPFIFSNFNGTANDIDVLTHEAGHAFQVFCSRDFTVSEFNFPTFEACEIHSMSMEFFTWPYMELFFGKNADKYRYEHMVSNIFFMPYGVAVDEFQEMVYNNPDASPIERKHMWKQVEKKYLPYRDYDGNPFLESGGFWQKQSHIYQIPFYYIDYVLALTCSFQFWQKDREDHQKAWNSYLDICNIGGSKPFLEIIKTANITSPFAPNSLEPLMKAIGQWVEENEPI